METYTDEERENAVCFYGEDNIFSNFYKCDPPIVIQRRRFKFTEHIFMLLKVVFFFQKDWIDAELFDVAKERLNDVKTPQQAKSVGKIKILEANLIDIWNDSSYEAMYYACWHKFQEPSRRKALMDTVNHRLVETSPRDDIWGVGCSELAFRRKPVKGFSKLGLVLEEIRETNRPPKNFDQFITDVMRPNILEEFLYKASKYQATPLQSYVFETLNGHGRKPSEKQRQTIETFNLNKKVNLELYTVENNYSQVFLKYMFGEVPDPVVKEKSYDRFSSVLDVKNLSKDPTYPEIMKNMLYVFPVYMHEKIVKYINFDLELEEPEPFTMLKLKTPNIDYIWSSYTDQIVNNIPRNRTNDEFIKLYQESLMRSKLSSFTKCANLHYVEIQMDLGYLEGFESYFEKAKQREGDYVKTITLKFAEGYTILFDINEIKIVGQHIDVSITTEKIIWNVGIKSTKKYVKNSTGPHYHEIESEDEIFSMEKYIGDVFDFLEDPILYMNNILHVGEHGSKSGEFVSKCIKCGKTLTAPSSIQNAVGPVCKRTIVGLF